MPLNAECSSSQEEGTRNAEGRYKYEGLPSRVAWNATSYIASITAIHRALTDNRALPCGPQLFDWFSETVSRECKGMIHREGSPAFPSLVVFHPRRPEYRHFLERYRAHHDFSTTNAHGGKFKINIGGYLVRAMFLINLDGAATEAAWVADEVRQYFPQVWSARPKVLRATSKDPKSQHLLGRQRGDATSASASDDFDHLDATVASPSAKYERRQSFEQTSSGDAVSDYLTMRGFGKD